MLKRIIIAIAAIAVCGQLFAQDLKSGPYQLPYKNTYVKNVFVAENPYRTAAPEPVQPKSYEEAKKIASEAREKLKTLCPALVQRAANS